MAASFDGMTPEAMAAWQRLSGATGYPLTVTSAFRDPAHNARVGGAKNSQHTHGNAFDIDVSDLSIEDRQALIEEARAAGFQGIGVYNNALHFDVGPSRAWGPNYSHTSLPDWASGVVNAPIGYATDYSQMPGNVLRGTDFNPNAGTGGRNALRAMLDERMRGREQEPQRRRQPFALPQFNDFEPIYSPLPLQGYST